jgi:hypothetical protein
MALLTERLFKNSSDLNEVSTSRLSGWIERLGHPPAMLRTLTSILSQRERRNKQVILTSFFNGCENGEIIQIGGMTEKRVQWHRLQFVTFRWESTD